MQVPLIFNPTAGRGRAARRIAAINATLHESGVDVVQTPSRAVGDTENLIRRAIDDGHRRIIVAGGDGSIGEAVNGILLTDPEVELGVIPIGTGNDFAKASSIPQHWEHAAALLADRLTSGAPSRPVDVGRCNGRYFANVAGIGFDAEVSAIARRIRLPIGDLVYLLALFSAMRGGVYAPRFRVSFGNTVIDEPLSFVSFCNGQWVGGLFQMAPDAANDDGLLDLVYAGELTRRRIMVVLPKLLRGKHIEEPEVQTQTLRKCTVVANGALISHLDGEIQPAQRSFEIELLPGALRLL